MTTQPTIQPIPLSSLQLSPLNARKTGGGNVDDLVASIAADGLLQNLTVVAGKKGKFDVVAGGRRLRTLQQLLREKRVPDNITVPCRVVDAAAAMEASTAENTIREQMNPADEIDAYAKLIEAGKSVTDIAVRFGQSERHVNGMLRLGTVSPVLIEDLRRGEIRLDQLKAFTVTDDHALQEKVWNDVKGSDWNDSPEEIRDALTERDIDAASKLARYITVDAYERAGGALRRDLFGDGVYLLDHLLADRLAMEKLERKAASVRKNGWAWVECRVDLPYSSTQKLERLYNATEADRAIAGMFVTIGHDGKAEVAGPYVRPGDRQRAEQGQEIPATEAAAKASKAPPKDDLSQSQVMHLLGARTALLRNRLQGNTRFMMTALAASLAADILGDNTIGDGVVKAQRGRWNSNPDFAAGMEAQDASDNAKLGTADDQHWQATFADMAGAHEIQQWLLERSPDHTDRLLGYLATQMLVLDDSALDEDAFIGRSGLDLAACWKATPEWLGTLSKPTTLRIVRAVLGAEAAEPLDKLKKGELAERAAHLLQDTGYLPAPLRPAGFDAPWAEAAP